MDNETQRLYGQCSYNNLICMISDLLFSFVMIKNAVLEKQHAPRAANFGQERFGFYFG